jgi:hypothetical protein
MKPRGLVTQGFLTIFLQKCMTFAHGVSCPPKARRSKALGVALHNAWGVTRFLAFISHQKSNMQENQQDERIQKSISGRN